MNTDSPVLRSAVAVLAIAFAVATLQAQSAVRPAPRIVEKNGRFALFVDDAPFWSWASRI
jgi:hypothetical protein